jgi:hypothetical protein
MRAFQASLIIVTLATVLPACGKSSATADAPAKGTDAGLPGVPTAVAAVPVVVAATVTTLAGTGSLGSANGSGGAASFANPTSVAVDAAGNVYVADAGNNLIRKVTAAGEVSTLAGTGSGGSANGSGTAATFNVPVGVAVDATGNVYVGDESNDEIRMISATGVVTTLAGNGAEGSANGSGSAASFAGPFGVAVDAAGNLFVADADGYSIRTVTQAGVVSTLAGTGSKGSANGSGSVASFSSPQGIAVDTDENVYIADVVNDLVRKIATVGIGQLAVTWNPPADSVVTSYTASAMTSGQTAKTCAADGENTCTISGLTSGVTYSVSVTATGVAGVGPPSAAVTAVPN